MFILDTTPDTSAYMIAGYVIFFILMILYLISLFIRTRNLNQDLKIIESMKEQSQVATSKPAVVKRSDSTRRTIHMRSTKPKVGKSNKVKKKVIKKR